MSALLLALAAALPPPRLKVEDWTVTRLRKARSGATGQVTTRFSLANISKKTVEEVRARVVFYDSLGNVSYKTKRARVKRIETGEREAVAISGTWVPVFLYYELFLGYRYDGRDESVTMLGRSAATAPEFLSDRLGERLIRLVVLGHELKRAPNGVTSVWARVKNFGSLEATEVKCVVRFYGPSHKKIGEIAYPLRTKKRPGVIKGGEDREARFILQNVPRHKGYGIYMKHAPPSKETLFSGGKFEMKEDVEVAHVKLKRTGPSVLAVELEVRNGLPEAAQDVVVTAVFLRKEKVRKTREDGLVGIFEEERAFRREDLKVRWPLDPGEVVHLKKTLRNMGSFSNMYFEIAFGEEVEEAQTAPAEGPRLEATVKAILKPDGTVEVTGKLTNAGKEPAAGALLKFHFRRKEDGKPVDVHVEDVRVEGPISPGGEKAFSFAVPDCPVFEEYFYELSSE